MFGFTYPAQCMDCMVSGVRFRGGTLAHWVTLNGIPKLVTSKVHGLNKCKLKIVCSCCCNAVPSKVCGVGYAVKAVILC